MALSLRSTNHVATSVSEPSRQAIFLFGPFLETSPVQSNIMRLLQCFREPSLLRRSRPYSVYGDFFLPKSMKSMQVKNLLSTCLAVKMIIQETKRRTTNPLYAYKINQSRYNDRLLIKRYGGDTGAEFVGWYKFDGEGLKAVDEVFKIMLDTCKANGFPLQKTDRKFQAHTNTMYHVGPLSKEQATVFTLKFGEAAAMLCQKTGKGE